MSQSPPDRRIIGEYGEALMKRYLEIHNIPFEREPVLSQTTRKIDCAIFSKDGSRVLVEVKTMWRQPPGGASAVDPHHPIRSHIADAARQFSNLPDTVNIVALVVFPGSFVDIASAHVMLGSMYGNIAFSFPFNTTTGQGDANAGQWVFVPGKGSMVKKEGEVVRPRKSRIAALLSLHARIDFWPDFGGREEIPFAEYARQYIAYVSSPASDVRPYVTLWENAGANTRVQNDLFTGNMDMRWGVDGETKCQLLSVKNGLDLNLCNYFGCCKHDCPLSTTSCSSYSAGLSE